jgi:hypothetical protein
MPCGGPYFWGFGGGERKSGPRNGPTQRTRKGKVKRGK